MPAISQAVAKNQARIAAGEPLVENVTPTPSMPVVPGALPPVVTSGLPVRGVYTPQQILATDFADNTKALRSGANLRSAAFPPPPQSLVQKIVTKVASATANIAASLLIKINNINSPNQSVLNILNGVGMSITADGSGNVTFNSTASGDGLVHGDPIWDVDSAVSFWRDDFYFGNGNDATPIGELGWYLTIGTGAFFNNIAGYAPHFGQVRIDTNLNAATCTSVYSPLGATPDSGAGGTTGGVMAVGMPLLDYPGWKMNWVFGFPINHPTNAASSFPLANTQFYCGLSVCASDPIATNDTWRPNGVNARPSFFVGLRYDTDPGANGGAAMTLTSVAAGTGVYQGTITGGAASAYAGYYVTITGFANAANNGIFLITASTSTAITTNNTASVIETHAGTATVPAISDTTFKFEVVSNDNLSNKRNNIAGTVVDTGITPKENIYYRLEMSSLAAGNVTMSLFGDDGSSFTNTFTSVPTTSVIGTADSSNFSLTVGHGVFELSQDGAATFGTSNMAWAIGSKVTITGALNSYFNKTWITGGDLQTTGAWLVYTGDATSITENNSGATQTGYPGLIPYFAWGNDTQSTPKNKSVGLDFWALAINQGLIGTTPNASLSRYW